MQQVNKMRHSANTITELHRQLGLPKPEHPLISVVNCSLIGSGTDDLLDNYVNNFYIISIKKDFKGKMKYGQQHYDFDEGVMSFLAPGQVISHQTTTHHKGLSLLFHPDFIRAYPLAKAIRNYGYFSYAVNEALHLSDKEETMILSLMLNIEQEYRSAIDKYSQNVMIAQIELLLNYCERFYNRQFITRRTSSNDLLARVEALLSDFFDKASLEDITLPTVQYCSDQLHVSPTYLSDTLRSLTGQNTQQHIHNKLIEKAKEILTTTNLSVSEIAYRLGFEYPQSFNKLFKNKTNLSPLQFRQSFN